MDLALISKRDLVGFVIIAIILNYLLKLFARNFGDLIINIEPKEIDFDAINPNPKQEPDLLSCEYLLRRINLIFGMEIEEIEPAFKRFNWEICFCDENCLGRVVEKFIEHKRNDLILTYLIPKAPKELLGIILYKCTLNRIYSCITLILEIDPMTLYNGRNILHIAANLIDERIFEHVPSNVLYLHLRDKMGNVPTRFIFNEISVPFFLKRANHELKTCPYPKELKAHIEYLKKTFDMDICSNKQRVDLLFKDPSWIQWNFQLHITISRESLYKNSFQSLHRLGSLWYSPSYFGSTFIDFVGENGIDENGLTRDWISSLIKCFFAANKINSEIPPLFRPLSDDTHFYVPTASSSEAHYKFAGSIIALALKYGISTRIEFIPSVYRLILDIEPIRHDDLEIVQPTIYKSFKRMRESLLKGEEIKGYSFENLAELDEFITEYTESVLYTRYKTYLKAFADGFRSKIPRKISKYLNLTDLKDILKGRVTITIEEFRKNFKFFGYLSNLDVQINQFFKALEDFSEEDRFKFIRFVTGRHGLPFGGLAEFESPIMIQFDAYPVGFLPTSNTCFNTLELPAFLTAKDLRNVILYAIYNCNTIDKE